MMYMITADNTMLHIITDNKLTRIFKTVKISAHIASKLNRITKELNIAPIALTGFLLFLINVINMIETIKTKT